MADTPRHSVSVAGVVVDDQDRVLVIQRRDNGHWEPPGGVLELEETPEDGAAREVLEETGIAVDVNHLTGVYKNMRQGIVALVFRCTARAGVACSSDESFAVQWIDRSDIPHLMDEAYAVRVYDALGVPAAPVPVRVHDGKKLAPRPSG